MGLMRLGHKPPLTIRPGATVLEAAHAMSERHVGAVIVVEDARAVGVLTERDLMRRVIAAERSPATTLVRDVMSTPVITVAEDTSVAAAAELMREHHIRHLVVAGEQGAPIAMIALRYLLYDLMDELENRVGDLEGYLMADAPGG